MQIIQDTIDKFVPCKTQTNIKKFPNHIQNLFLHKSKMWSKISDDESKAKFLLSSKTLDREISRFLRNRENKQMSSQNTKFDYYTRKKRMQ